MSTLLEVEDLCVDLAAPDGTLRLVDGVSFKVEAGETVGLVGESGCGKSMTAFALLNLFPTPRLNVARGAIRFEGQDLTALSPQAWRALRGARLAMVFQDPSGFLDPLMPRPSRRPSAGDGCDAVAGGRAGTRRPGRPALRRC